jgi:hypothetical protein
MLPILLATALAAEAVPPAPVDHAAARLLHRAGNGEPAVGEVQRAAADLASAGASSSWRSRARLAALVPRVSADLKIDERRYRVVGLTASSEVDYVRDSPSMVIGFRLSWDLGGLVFADAELRAAQQASATAKVRAEAVRQATRVYYERQRLLLEVASEPAATARERAEQELRLEELAAELDALTGGLYARGER